MTVTKEHIIEVLQPVIKKWRLRRYDLGHRNVTFSSDEYSRLISVVEHDTNDVVIIIRDNPDIYPEQFAKENILPLLVKNNISFDTIGYQSWTGKIIYKIKSESFMDVVKTM